jgi:hypothetical protein
VIASHRLPEAVARCVEPSAPEQLRIVMARGGIPLAPADRLSALAVLFEDPSPAVREEARKAWDETPSTFFEQALADPQLPDVALHRIAENATGHPKLLLRALEHPSVGAETLAGCLDSEDEEVLSRVAGNQRVLRARPDLAGRLLENPRLPAAERSRLVSIFRPETEEEVTEGEEEATRAAESVELPADLPAELLEDVDEAQDSEPKNLYQLVQSLSVFEKIKLATLGSKGARRLLIRDSNRLVQAAVIRSPKIREDEVLSVVQDRTAPEEVIRIVLSRKDWLKNYPIRLALCQNPKTPVPRALRLLETLHEKDLRQLSKSRNVPAVVASGALRALSRRGRI